MPSALLRLKGKGWTSLSSLFLLIGFDTQYLLHWNRQKPTKRGIECPRTILMKGQKRTNGAKENRDHHGTNDTGG